MHRESPTGSLRTRPQGGKIETCENGNRALTLEFGRRMANRNPHLRDEAGWRYGDRSALSHLPRVPIADLTLAWRFERYGGPNSGLVRRGTQWLWFDQHVSDLCTRVLYPLTQDQLREALEIRAIATNAASGSGPSARARWEGYAGPDLRSVDPVGWFSFASEWFDSEDDDSF